jgi:hypothetical protein
MSKLPALEEQIRQIKPIAQNMAICCAIDLLGEDAVELLAAPFRDRCQQIIAYRKAHRMTPFGPVREASDA